MSAKTTTRLPVQTVELLNRQVGGDPRVEAMVLKFISDKFNSKNLFYLPPNVGAQIIKRPADFLAAVKQHCDPEFGL